MNLCIWHGQSTDLGAIRLRPSDALYQFIASFDGHCPNLNSWRVVQLINLASDPTEPTIELIMSMAHWKECDLDRLEDLALNECSHESKENKVFIFTRIVLLITKAMHRTICKYSFFARAHFKRSKILYMQVTTVFA